MLKSFIQKVYILKRFIVIMTNTAQNNSEKKISRYKINFSTSKNLVNNDYLVLELSINDNLKDLLNKYYVVKNETVDYSISTLNGKRYLIKGVINRQMYGSYFLLLADKNLIDNGKMVLILSSVEQFEHLKRDIATNFKTIIAYVRDYSEINVTMTIEG